MPYSNRAFQGGQEDRSASKDNNLHLLFCRSGVSNYIFNGSKNIIREDRFQISEDTRFDLRNQNLLVLRCDLHSLQ